MNLELLEYIKDEEENGIDRYSEHSSEDNIVIDGALAILKALAYNNFISVAEFKTLLKVNETEYRIHWGRTFFLSWEQTEKLKVMIESWLADFEKNG